jgi:hypothetical protein
MVLLAAALTACTCQPELPADDVDSDPVSTGVTGATADTGPPPPCDQPEVEPNDALVDPPLIALERHACGTFGSEEDVDAWGFALESEGWLSVELESGEGGISDVDLHVGPASLSWVVERGDDSTESNDAHLLFLAPADAYTVYAREAADQYGERATWDLLVSEAKPPRAWTRVEAEPNDLQGTAEDVVSGDVVFGTMEGNPGLPDRDWFTIEIPPGKQTLTVSVEAWGLGSSADLTLYLVDSAGQFLPSGCDPCAVEDSGPPRFERDPAMVYDSPGGETVAIQIVGIDDVVESPASWYTITFDVEGE